MKRPVNKLNIMRFLAFLLICSTLISLTALSASALESGAVGDNISWVLDAGTLTITGTGKMTNYRDSELPPWYEFRDQIVRVVISDKITSIGNFAFYGCKNLTTVTLPNSVKTIGNYAFASCKRLATVHMSGSVSSIGNGAFYSCSALESIRLPYGLSYLGSQAFYRCESLKSISIPSDVRTMGDSVFAYCKALVRAEVHARINQLPAWTFYGCSQLSEILLAETISDIDNNSFKKCDSLSIVYFSGNEKQAEKIEDKISEDVVSFEISGYITSETIPESTTSGVYVEKDESTSVQTNTVVVQNDNYLLNYTVERIYKIATNTATYTANVILTIENDKFWEDAGAAVVKALNDIGSTYDETSKAAGTTVTLYVKNNISVSRAFLNRLAGKEVKLSVSLSNGSGWSIDCRDLKVQDLTEEVSNNYSHTLKEAPEEVSEKLGTDDCYRIVFDESATQKAEVVVQLPTQTATNTNAFLYQIEEDGSYKKLQGVAVDNNGCANFYINSVDKMTDYIIGLDVIGESTDDVIIPDELITGTPSNPIYGSSALDRLEQIQYVESARNYHMGVGYGGLTWILIAVLVVTTIIVGGIMTIINKSQKAKMQMRKT